MTGSYEARASTRKTIKIAVQTIFRSRDLRLTHYEIIYGHPVQTRMYIFFRNITKWPHKSKIK